jgi:ElaB/YqjD/DUF883 family membrane-anchored ribosome-binding protein
VADVDELMRAHASGFLLRCHEALPELVRELQLAREDVVAAAGELIVEMPRPGTDMARVMLANAAMRRERDQLRAEVERLQRAAVPGNGPEMLRMQVENKRLAAEVERLKAELESAIDDHNEAAAAKLELSAQLRELREAADDLVSESRDAVVELRANGCCKSADALESSIAAADTVLAKVGK